MRQMSALLVLYAVVACADGVNSDESDPRYPRVPEIQVSPATSSLQPGDSVQLNVSFRNVATQAVSWTSLDAAVASVNATGVVHGIARGTTQIRVATSSGDLVAKVSVQVR